MTQTVNLEYLAERLVKAKSLAIVTGAGMGVDSGFATFRGEDGLWPSIEERIGTSYLDWAVPGTMWEQPHLSWGFYGTRLQNYRTTEPHEGYKILRSWRDTLFSEGKTFFFTTNVDGHALKAFPEHEVVEQHGSLYYAQGVDSHSGPLVDISEHVFDIDPETLLCSDETLPRGPEGELLRPNARLFDDFYFNGERYYDQVGRYLSWRYENEGDLVVIEIGCGDEVQVGRHEARILRATASLGTHIRINPCEVVNTVGVHHLQMGALEGLRTLDEAILQYLF